MKTMTFAVLVALSVPGSALAQERVLGLLSLPEVFGPRQCAPFEPSTDRPARSAERRPPIAFIRVDQNWSFAPHGGCEGLEVSVHQGSQHHDLPTREYDYEMPGAIVVEHRDGWFKVGSTSDRRGSRRRAVDRFMPIADLYEEFVGVTAINQSFTGRLSSTPGATTGPIMPRVVPSQPVRVLEIRGEWVRVEVLSNSACTAANDGPPEVVATGWLPLHDREGEPTVWFSSRGCNRPCHGRAAIGLARSVSGSRR